MRSSSTAALVFATWRIISSGLLSAPEVYCLAELSASMKSRRDFLSIVGTASAFRYFSPASASVTDETDTFGDNWWSSKQQTATKPAYASTPQSQVAASDEVKIAVSASKIQERGGLGIELADIEFRTNRRVFVKSIKPGALASEVGIQKDWVIISVNGQSTERTNAQGAAQILSTAIRQSTDGTIELGFRDPFAFREKLNTLASGESVTTQVAPAGDTTIRNPDGSVQSGRLVTAQSDQKLTVTQLVPPRICKRGAQEDDLLEISYVGSVLETGAIFDGSAVKINGEAIPGRANDVSLFFVLGKQPFGQFPPGWDVGLVGMCVGERRRLIIPPGLAYGSTGLPRRGIPPNATLQYDITLVSVNGLAN